MSSRLVLASTCWKCKYEELRWGSNMRARSLRIWGEIIGFLMCSRSPKVLLPSPWQKNFNFVYLLTLKRRLTWSPVYAWWRSKSSMNPRLTVFFYSISVQLFVSFYKSLLILSILSFGASSSSSSMMLIVGFFFWFCISSIINRLWSGTDWAA